MAIGPQLLVSLAKVAAAAAFRSCSSEAERKKASRRSPKQGAVSSRQGRGATALADRSSDTAQQCWPGRGARTNGQNSAGCGQRPQVWVLQPLVPDFLEQEVCVRVSPEMSEKKKKTNDKKKMIRGSSPKVGRIGLQRGLRNGPLSRRFVFCSKKIEKAK